MRTAITRGPAMPTTWLPTTPAKCGVAVRFPRIRRWRTDKPLHEADTMPTLDALLTGAP